MSANKFTLTLLDTTGIQEYIFASNRLQENIGASELVYRATSLWAFKALQDAGITEHNLDQPESLEWKYNDRAIESDAKLQAEVIQAAGGNTVILFREPDKAREFVRKLTLSLLNDAPGLTVLAQHLDNFDFDAAKLSDAREEIERAMRSHKVNRLVSTPAMGLGVTAMCASTGLAAVNSLKGKLMVEGRPEQLGLPGEDETTLVSRETAAKRAWRKSANARLKTTLKNAADDFIFPYDLEKLGRIQGEESYIAVIHADGNRMGAHVRQIAKTSPNNRAYIQNMRDFSRKINAISQTALEIVVGLVVQAVKHEDIPFVEDEDGKYLPFRPLVFGGDDVTFVSSGLIGVSLATAYLEAFENEALKQGDDLHASAGVSIVKMRYPFARAYKLSEELAGSAKSLTRETDCSALDWHFAQSGLSGSLKVIREREYTSDDRKSLCLRPLILTDWHKLESVMDEFNGGYWGEKRNKVIGLREFLRKDPEAVEKYRQDFGLRELPEIAGEKARQTGWLDGKCHYFDAIELLDHHVSLKDKDAEK